ncbi:MULTISPECIES: Na+/H+ antiporter subunit E [unclassified Lentilitoribacter]|uniref:Na+/H+ antiporter subunit E n=1 Tax=unclassified Lentilitoribacter TaxID=2647570 RepID=UPI0013A6BD49|nr:Na+/H+ antiporter subunit E [Lentilitoribacter sp. Alg239-R112]
MMLFIFNILLTFAWAAITGSFSALNMLFGFVLSIFALWIIRGEVGSQGYFSRSWRIIKLFTLFLYELVMSAWKVMVLVLSPRLDVKPGIFKFPLSLEDDMEITLLASMITLTPGTLSVDTSEDKKFIYVHAIDASDPEGARRDIADGFERKIKEAFH